MQEITLLAKSTALRNWLQTSAHLGLTELSAMRQADIRQITKQESEYTGIAGGCCCCDFDLRRNM